ncbi:NAD(P)-dependent alcohol dehydrogenase [Planctomycetota bacterium]|nr:NAD(P)-dependent alcohol dehydrogenase [Planctomycetota bacterium]
MVMKAAVFTGYGDPLARVMVRSDVDEPRVKGDEILVEVRASSVMLLDGEVIKGDYKLLSEKWLKKRNVVTGFEVAGIARSDGKQIKHGDEIYGYVNILKGGVGHACYAVVPESAMYVKPKNVNFEEAAGLPVGMMTAMDAFENKVLLHEGDEVLIHGAAGGVGVYAVQLAKKYGVRVTASCGKENEELMKQLGADEVCSHELDVEGMAGRFMMLYDVAGNLDYLTIRDMLEPGGKYVTTAIDRDYKAMVHSTIDGKHIEKQMVLEGEKGILKRITEMVENGEVRPVIDEVYALDRIVHAYKRVHEHGKHGRVIVTMHGQMGCE